MPDNTEDIVLADVALEPGDHNTFALAVKCDAALKESERRMDELLSAEGGESRVAIYFFTAAGMVTHCWPHCQVKVLGARRGYVIYRAAALARLQARAAGILFDPNDLIRVLVGRVREYDLMFQVLSS